MPALALFAFSNLSHDLKLLWAWLCHRSFWQLTTMAAVAVAVFLLFQRNDARSDAVRWQKQDAGHVAELKAISTKRNQQVIVTRDRIVIAERKAKDADGVAKKIEAAPIMPGCRTAPEIMGADL